MPQKKQTINCRKCQSKRAEVSPALGYEAVIVWLSPFSPYHCLSCYKRFWFLKKASSNKSFYFIWLLFVAVLVTYNVKPHWLPTIKVDQSTDSLTNNQNPRTNDSISAANITNAESSVVLDTVEQRALVMNLAFNEPGKDRQHDDFLEPPEFQPDDGLAQSVTQQVSLESKQQQVDPIQVDPQELQSLLKVDINHFIEQWRQAWQSGDSETYLSLYSAQFIPPDNASLSSWQQQRIQMVVPSKQIAVELSNFDVTLDENNQKSVVIFDQEYKSSSYTEKSRKQLSLTKESEWRIVSELTIE